MKRELEFASHPANLGQVREFIRLFLKPLAFTDLEKDLIVLGLDEACTNVIRYAYLHQPDQPMHLVCEEHDDQVVFRLRDYGTQCDPSKLNGRPLDLIQPGGLGIHLIRRAFSQVDYHLQKQGTELVLSKQYRPTATEPG